MADAAIVGVLHRCRQVLHQPGRLRRGDRLAAALALPEPGREGGAGDVLGGEVAEQPDLADVKDPDEVGVIERGRGFGLAQEALAQRRREEDFRVGDFQGDVTVELGTETKPARAEVLEGAARDEVWERQKQLMPGFAEYEAKTSRTIPVIALHLG